MRATIIFRDFLRHAGRLAADTRGATAIEYAIIAAGIGVAVVTVVTKLGTTTNSLFANVSTLLK